MNALELPLRGLLVEKPLGHLPVRRPRHPERIRARRLRFVAARLLVRTTPLKVLAHVAAGDIGKVQLIEIRCTGWTSSCRHPLAGLLHNALDSPDMDHVMALCDTSSRTYRDGLQVETVAATYAVTRGRNPHRVQTGTLWTSDGRDGTR